MDTSLTLANNSFRLNSGTGRRIAALVLAILMISALMMTTAFAEDGDAITSIESGVKSGMQSVFKVIQAIVTPIAAIVFAASGIKMLFGGERGVESAKKTMLIAAIAIAVVYLAPIVASQVQQWFKGTGDGGVFGTASETTTTTP